MRTIALAAGALLAAAATGASAQVYYDRGYAYDPYYNNRFARAGDECWNPRAGHFEEVRPGEVQNDLDFSRCRPRADNRYWGDYRNDYRDYRSDYRRECWNPRAGHYEEDRPGEFQGDLDYRRCRLARY